MSTERAFSSAIVTAVKTSVRAVRYGLWMIGEACISDWRERVFGKCVRTWIWSSTGRSSRDGGVFVSVEVA